jgi:hypothetical protein
LSVLRRRVEFYPTPSQGFFVRLEVHFFGLISSRRCAQPRSVMAEGHCVAAQSVLDGGETTPPSGRSGITPCIGSGPYGTGMRSYNEDIYDHRQLDAKYER